MKPVYFDLSVADVPSALRFFRAVLGWEFRELFPGSFRIRAGPEGEPGIDGGLGAIAAAPVAGGRPLTVVTVPVADLDAQLARVVAAGGRVVEPRLAVPGVGWYATCVEPGGLLFGMMQEDPGAL